MTKRIIQIVINMANTTNKPYDINFLYQISLWGKKTSYFCTRLN